MIKNLLGVASGFFADFTKEKWQSAVKAGLTEVEFGLWGFQPDNDTFGNSDEKCALIKESGVNVSSCHLPFGGIFDISVLEETKCANAVIYAKKSLDWIASKNIGIAVIHASAEPVADYDRSVRLTKASENIKELGIYAKERNVILAVENLPRTCLGNCANDMLVLTDNGKSASICFDVNHLLIESHKDFYEKVAPYVVTTHLSDYDRIDERHWLPGDGCINWTELTWLFEKNNYTGRYIFEINESSSPKLDRIFSPAELVERFKVIQNTK